MQGTSSIYFEANKLPLNGTSELQIGLTDYTLTMEGSSDLDLDLYLHTTGNVSLPAITAFGGEVKGYGAGNTELPILYSEGSGGSYVPAALERGINYLRGLISTGRLLTSVPGEGSTVMPSLFSIGGEGNFGFGEATLQSFTSSGLEGEGNYTATINEVMVIASGTGAHYEGLILISEEGTIVDTISGTKEVIREMLDSITGTDTYSAIGAYYVLLDEEVSAQSYQVGSPATAEGDTLGLNTVARVWVVSLENNASGQFENYGYNSYFEKDGVHYGVGEDGIYKLEGSSDNGFEIDALIEIGKSNLGTPYRKNVKEVYMGVSSTNKVYMKVVCDSAEYTYVARSSNEDMFNHRVDIGRGLRGNYFNFIILNDKGSDIDLETVNFTPVKLSRKI